MKLEMLNKNDSAPLYIQLKQLIRKKILNNELKEMDFLPSESQLMKKFKITRTTIRKAISELKQEGLVQQIQGKGVYVKTRELKETVWNFQSFSDLVMRYNKEPVTRLLEKEEVLINKKNFLKLVRLRGFKQNTEVVWLTIEKSYLPLAIFGGIEEYDFETNSIYKLMKEQFGVKPYYADMSITPINSSKYLKEKFDFSIHQPLLKSSGKVFTENKIEIEQLEIIYSPNFNFKLSQYIDM